MFLEPDPADQAPEHMLSSIRRLTSFNWCTATTFTQDIMDLLDKEKETSAASAAKEKVPYKSRYDGRKKKRQWQGGTSDYSEQTPRAKMEKADDAEPFERIKRKKYALLLGYCGKTYYGMQRNPGMETIEEKLLLAMKKHEWIAEDWYDAPQRGLFQRAARTDKGVSAARQCVSVKIRNDVNIEELNKDLPEDIRLFAVKRVTKGFNSKDQCDARTYTYTLPTVALTSHDKLANVTYEGYRTDAATLEKANEVLKLYEGTKSFHNFTAKKGFNDPSAKRVILSFTCGEPFILRNVEFVTLKVKGQSFMLHQIRKMVGLALAIIRGLADKSAIALATSKIIMDIPTAPGLGLMLDTVHYDRYNRRYAEDGSHQPLDWKDEQETVEAFIRSVILPQILDTEVTDKPMLEWLDYLKRHTYVERKEGDQKLFEPEDEVRNTSDEAPVSDETMPTANVVA